MPVDYQIDRQNAVVLATARGVLAADDIMALRRRLAADPDFSPDMKQLIDLLGVTEVKLRSKDLRFLASFDPFGPGARRAFVGDQDITFGVLRMYEVLAERPGTSVHVFRDMEAAREWLGIGTTPR